MKQVLEYIWLDGEGKFRSKVRVTENVDIFPEWSYDGSSTGQASDSGNTEIILKPVFYGNNPFIRHTSSYLVLCDTANREKAVNIFNENLDAKPWFGLEQEFFFSTTPTNIFFDKREAQGRFYCGVGLCATQRKIVEEHLEACINAGIQISGTNAEVAPNQWEFQIGPCEGIEAADHLLMARYILEFNNIH